MMGKNLYLKKITSYIRNNYPQRLSSLCDHLLLWVIYANNHRMLWGMVRRGGLSGEGEAQEPNLTELEIKGRSGEEPGRVATSGAARRDSEKDEPSCVHPGAGPHLRWIPAPTCPLGWGLVSRIQPAQPGRVALESRGRAWEDPLRDGLGNFGIC